MQMVKRADFIITTVLSHLLGSDAHQHHTGRHALPLARSTESIKVSHRISRSTDIDNL